MGYIFKKVAAYGQFVLVFSVFLRSLVQFSQDTYMKKWTRLLGHSVF